MDGFEYLGSRSDILCLPEGVNPGLGEERPTTINPREEPCSLVSFHTKVF